MTTLIRIPLTLSLLLMLVFSCKKNNDQPAPATDNKLSYGDSIFYIRSQAADYMVSPVDAPAGQYFGFPQGIELDGNTGAINVSKSEAGLRYRIFFVPAGTEDTLTTVITISGVNFLDGFYKLSAGDSIVYPVYNGRKDNPIPGLNNGSLFDEGSNCNSLGCNVDVVNGQINLAQTVRNGVFGSIPSNNDRHEFQMNYRINDKSQEAANTIKVKLYYFDTMSDVTQEVYDIISSREGTIIESTGNPRLNLPPRISSPITVMGVPGAGKAKPRPPCIFIVRR